MSCWLYMPSGVHVRMFDCISFVSYMTYSSIHGNQHESIGNQVISFFKILLERPKVNNCQTLNFGNIIVTGNLKFFAFDNLEFQTQAPSFLLTPS